MENTGKLYVKHWYAVHTKSHHEKMVELRVKDKGIETFLPVRCLKRKWKDRMKMVDFPLFPGYLFVNISLVDKKKIVQTSGVVKMVGTREPEPIPEQQIEAIRIFIAEEIQFDPYPYLVPGLEVEVMRGPLTGVRGVLAQRKGKYRLVVNVPLLNNSIATEIDAEDVLKLE